MSASHIRTGAPPLPRMSASADGDVTTAIPVSGPPNMRQIVANDPDGSGHVEVTLSKGLQAFSFTYG